MSLGSNRWRLFMFKQSPRCRSIIHYAVFYKGLTEKIISNTDDIHTCLPNVDLSYA